MKKQLIAASILLVACGTLSPFGNRGALAQPTRTQQQTQGQGEASEGPAPQTLEQRLAQDPAALITAVQQAFPNAGSVKNPQNVADAVAQITGQGAPAGSSQQLKSMGRLGRNK